MNKTGFILSLLFLCTLMTSRAQQPVLSGNPGTVQWDQVQTPSFQVIYPSGYDRQALRIANMLEHLKEEEAETMSESLPQRIPIILNNFQAISNAFVTMGPWRSEFNMMPSPRPDLQGTNQWDELIAAHEYRHVVQFHHSRRGFNRLIYYVFGQQTQAGMAFAAVPRWFWEGDATLIETLYTPSGRGRIPAFSRIFRTNLIEHKRYDYNKQHLGSYRDFVPDHYRLGYYFVTNIRRRSRDPEIWEKITADAYEKSIVPFTFSNALKKYTGVHLVPNYNIMMDELYELWNDEDQALSYQVSDDVNRRRETTFTDYMYPQELADGRIVSFMSGLGDVQQLVTFDASGYPKPLFIPGIVNDAGMLSVRGNKIVFNEYQFDPRWRNRTYSVIKIYDTGTGRVRILSDKSRYIGADLSPDQRKIVTAESRPDDSNNLVIIDALSGNRLNTLPNASGGLYLQPRWDEAGRHIVAVKLDGDGKKIVLVDYMANDEKVLWDAGHENIGHPVIEDSLVYYNSPLSGIDNIFALDMNSGRRYQVTKSRYGAYNGFVSADGQYLVFNEHRLNGMDVVRMQVDPSRWTQVEDTVSSPVSDYFVPILEQEGQNLLDSIPSVDYPVTKYSKAAHMFNVHSWGPLASTDLNSIELGLASRDVLSTTVLSAGYVHDLAENTGSFYGQLSYQDLYPIIDVGVEAGSRSSDRGSFNGEDEIILDWKETTFYGGIRLPFLLTRSKMLSEFTVSNRVGITRVRGFDSSVPLPSLNDSVFNQRLVPLNRSNEDSLAYFFSDELADGTLLYNDLSLTYYALLKRSPRDINSRYGVVLSGKWISTPYGGDFTAGTIAARATVYLPSPLQLTGIPVFKHHSLYFMGALQTTNDDFEPDLYVFRNQIPRPRGYSYPLFPDFTYAGVNYTMPVWYPDISAGPVIFLKRLRTNAFFDYGQGKRNFYLYDYKNQQVLSTPEQTVVYRSAGLEVMADLNIMRFAQEIGIGVRYSRLLSTDANSFDLLLNIEF